MMAVDIFTANCPRNQSGKADAVTRINHQGRGKESSRGFLENAKADMLRALLPVGSAIDRIEFATRRSDEQ